MTTGEVRLPLLSAFQRLIDLLAEPSDIRILAPIILREFLYRILLGDRATILGCKRLTGTLLNRLTHRCHIIEANGESYRFPQARLKLKLPPWPI